MDGYVTIGTELDTKDFDREIEHLQKYLKDLEEDYDILSREKPFENQENELRKLSSQITQTKKKIQSMTKAKEEFNKSGFSNIQNSIQGIGSGIEGVTKKITRWALAIFGIRGAINFIRNSMGVLSQYNEQMGVDVEYIRYLLASTLQPVIENLIKLAYKLLAYVNYIANAWFRVNLFANASTEAFQKQNKALDGSVKKAKELQKTLAGFDEMNIIQDNGDVSSGGGGGGVSLPSFPDMSSIERPWWLDWIVDNKDLIIATLSGIAAGIIAMNLSDLAVKLGLVKNGLKAIQGLGIGVIIAGVVMLIQDIIDMIQDPSWQNFVAILGDIAIIIGGIMLVMGNWWGLLVVLVGLAVKLIAENWDSIKEILRKVGGWIFDHIIKPVGDFFSGLLDGIKSGVVTAVQWVKDKFNSIVSFFSGLISKIVGLFKTIGTTVGDVISGAFKGVINGVLSAIENILNFPIKSINKLIDTINSIPGVNLGKLSTFKLPRLAKGGIINQPGRGVPIGQAIGGEHSMEGVIPLTDSQMMSLLGKTIGEYITINANITNTMNGRVISRELQKIQNRDDFLYNR